jgi:lipoprotein-anchoring transpeptidase ErfK/SrfK
MRASLFLGSAWGEIFRMVRIRLTRAPRLAAASSTARLFAPALAPFFARALIAGCLFTPALHARASAQYGTPSQYRDVTPTIEDSDPGVAPDEAAELPAAYRRTSVFYRSDHPPGTIIVNTRERFLYLTRPNNLALRYGIGVGRDGFQWSGLLKVARKSEWPDWTPPHEMIERQPYLPRFMAGGPGNPMGARALYLGGTVYRIHGTNAPQTIGHAVSSGCFRLVNDEIIDLYERVPVGTKVVVHQ